MGASGQNASRHETTDEPPPLSLDIRRLKPLEIVLIRRCAHHMPLDGFPAFDQLAAELEEQLEDLPQTDLPFAREVYNTFAMSPYAIDRLHVGLLLPQLTLADHDTGFALWHQLVRDEHPTVQRDTYQPIREHLTKPEPTAIEELGRNGLTLADGHRLRSAFIDAQYLGGRHVIDQTPATEALQEATHSFESIVRL
jgi:hypothetical protein